MSIAGRTLYHFWHRPLGALSESRRHGGPLNQWKTACGRLAMEHAAGSLALPPSAVSPLVLTPHFLTGRRYAYQTAFCLASLARHCPGPIAPEFYDDGSFDDASRNLLKRLFPSAPFHSHAELRERLDSYLPTARFPVLRDRWLNYPHIRKLIDVHLGRSGWRLVMDSDLLFWREPQLLLDWTRTPAAPLHATDCIESYGYPRALLEEIAGCKIHPFVNVGLCGLRSDSIDWDFLEHASATLISQHGTSYYLEQALVALLVARHPVACVIAPAKDYITYPTATEIAAPSAVMHHYVDISRDAYHRQAWRLAITPGA